MDWIAFFVICMNIVALQAKHDLDWSNPIILIKRRHSFRRHPGNRSPILRVPIYPEDLPEAESIMPGHTLIRPSLGMLKSAAKFPLRDFGGSLVYGNVDNIGLANDNNERVLYTNFRKSDDLVEQLKKTIENSKTAAWKGKKGSKKHKIYQNAIPKKSGLKKSHTKISGKKENLNRKDNNDRVMYSNFRTSDDIVEQPKKTIENSKTAAWKGKKGSKMHKIYQNAITKKKKLDKIPFGPAVGYKHLRANKLIGQKLRTNKKFPKRETFKGPKIYISKRNFKSLDDPYDQENDAREILDKVDPDRRYFEENSDKMDFRRKSKKYRKRSYESSDDSENSDTATDSDSDEKNPGNPYSIFKNKYKQNWMWNHVMDGDHMNINPYGPNFQNAGPSGSDLFYGRKWWYFNQDDYVPMK